MAQGPDSRDEASSPEESSESGGSGEKSDARPRAELRRVRVREPRHALEVGRNDRIVDSHYHESDDAWEVLLEIYDENEGAGTET